MRSHLATILGLVVSLLSAGDAPGAVTIVEDGRPRAAIVLPIEPNQGEKRAAEELRVYVEKASGAELPILKEDEAWEGPKIVLGRACRDLTRQAAGDGFTVETRGDAVMIAGGNQRGTLYGAYDLLEDQLGIRWFMPGEIGEVVPEAATVIIPSLSRHERPSFEYRWIGPGSEWSARNRNNVGLAEIGINIFRSAHTFSTFLDPDKYFDEHPQWYALVGGVRRRNQRHTHGNQICTSNPEAVREVIKNIREFLDENPDVAIVTLFPNDGNWFCECPNCKALDEPGWASVEEINRHGRAAGLRGYGTLSRRMTIFNNTVARAIGETHPHVMVKVGAYSCYTNPPNDASLGCAENVIVQICHGWCHNHPITDPGCPVNADFRKAIEGWGRIAPGGVMLYEYYYKVAQCELPFPIIHSMREDLPYFKRIGVRGVYTQYTSNWGTLTLPYYVAARLLWDVEADVDALLDDFYRKFYGPAAGPMRRYYERLEKAAIDSGLHFSPPYYRFPEVFTDACLADCRKYLEEAKQLANTEKIQQRLAMVETSLTYTELVMDYVGEVRRVDEKKQGVRWHLDMDPNLFAEAKDRAEVVREFMSRPQGTNVIRESTSYVDRLLNPQTTFQFRYDRTDPRLLDEKKNAGLTKRGWLAASGKHEPGRLPEAFDLWIYGYDFDAGRGQSEHELAFLHQDGTRALVGPLPPEGQASNRKTGCVVYQGLNWPHGGGDVLLKLEIVNRPGDWTGSTLLAVYVMPAGLNVSHEKAAGIIRDHPDWAREQAIGFVELGFRGLSNDESQPARIDVELLGPPKHAPVVPD